MVICLVIVSRYATCGFPTSNLTAMGSSQDVDFNIKMQFAHSFNYCFITSISSQLEKKDPLESFYLVRSPNFSEPAFSLGDIATEITGSGNHWLQVAGFFHRLMCDLSVHFSYRVRQQCLQPLHLSARFLSQRASLQSFLSAQF